MAEDQYVVVQRDEKWWIIIDGERRGPFDQRQEAIDAAVGAVRINERLGRDGEVSWDDPDDGTPTVYKSNGH